MHRRGLPGVNHSGDAPSDLWSNGSDGVPSGDEIGKGGLKRIAILVTQAKEALVEPEDKRQGADGVEDDAGAGQRCTGKPAALVGEE